MVSSLFLIFDYENQAQFQLGYFKVEPMDFTCQTSAYTTMENKCYS
jgi:hypothetical protein